MPTELRFCRNCGFRLGEGPAEYTETVRFQDVRPGTLPVNGPGNPFAGVTGQMTAYPTRKLAKRKRRMSGMTWIFIGLLVFFVCAAGFTAIIRSDRQPTIGRGRFSPRIMAGVSGWENANGGVTFNNVTVPNSPADKAGLVGGDIITTYDGKAVTDEDQMADLMNNTPVGKAVDVVFIRDGETKTTQLTAISRQEYQSLESEFRSRPQGIGLFGFDDDDTKRVPIEGTSIFGILLEDVSRNGPAELSGIREGDIVIEFGGVPIRTSEELAARVRRAIPYEPTTVVVMREGQRLEIPVRMGKRG